MKSLELKQVIKESGMGEHQTLELLRVFTAYQKSCEWSWVGIEGIIRDACKTEETQLLMFEEFEKKRRACTTCKYGHLQFSKMGKYCPESENFSYNNCIGGGSDHLLWEPISA